MPLTGKELLQKVKSLDGLSEKEMAEACGYISDTGKISIIKFQQALLAASGFDFNSSSSGQGRGRKPTNLINVQASQIVVLSKAYTQQLGLVPGDALKIKIEPKKGRIVLEKESLNREEESEYTQPELALV